MKETGSPRLLFENNATVMKLGLQFIVAPTRTTGIGYAVVPRLKPTFTMLKEENGQVIYSWLARDLPSI